MACPDTQIFLGFFSTASPEWLRTCPEGMSGDSGHLADPPELPWYTHSLCTTNTASVLHRACAKQAAPAASAVMAPPPHACMPSPSLASHPIQSNNGTHYVVNTNSVFVKIYLTFSWTPFDCCNSTTAVIMVLSLFSSSVAVHILLGGCFFCCCRARDAHKAGMPTRQGCS